MKPNFKGWIYVMRHGKTALDGTNRSDGWIDLPLNDEGRAGVVTVIDNYLRNVPITCIYAPPLKRTLETAHILQSGLNSHPEIEEAPDAVTWNLGDLAGALKKPNKQIVKYLLSHPNVKAPHGESYSEFTSRFDTWLNKQKKDVMKEGPFVLVLSGSACRRISELLFEDRTILNVSEAGLFLMYSDGGQWSASLIDDAPDGDPGSEDS